MRLVLKLSGRVFDDVDAVSAYARMVRDLVADGRALGVVVGGGETARRYIAAARALGSSEADLDRIGMAATRLNAMLMISALRGVAYPRVPETLEETVVASERWPVVVLGGLQPGQSTTMVAALVAEATGTHLIINCANVDAVYTDDPRTNPNARPLDEVTLDELEALIRGKAHAGTYELADPWSIAVMRRSGISMYVVDWRDVGRVRGVVLGTERPGTRIIPRRHGSD